METLRVLSAIFLLCTSAASGIMLAAELTPTVRPNPRLLFWGTYGAALAAIFIIAVELLFGG
jgi:hypothetical protein